MPRYWCSLEIIISINACQLKHTHWLICGEKLIHKILHLRKWYDYDMLILKLWDDSQTSWSSPPVVQQWEIVPADRLSTALKKNSTHIHGISFAIHITYCVATWSKIATSSFAYAGTIIWPYHGQLFLYVTVVEARAGAQLELQGEMVREQEDSYYCRHDDLCSRTPCQLPEVLPVLFILGATAWSGRNCNQAPGTLHTNFLWHEKLKYTMYEATQAQQLCKWMVCGIVHESLFMMMSNWHVLLPRDQGALYTAPCTNINLVLFRVGLWCNARDEVSSQAACVWCFCGTGSAFATVLIECLCVNYGKKSSWSL